MTWVTWPQIRNRIATEARRTAEAREASRSLEIKDKRHAEIWDAVREVAVEFRSLKIPEPG